MALVNLTDDELWRAIVHNTDAMSSVLRQQLELNRRPEGLQAILLHATAQTISALERQYRIYSAELRRRNSTRGNRANSVQHP